MNRTAELACACGGVRFELRGAPIVGAECHCNSCREAGGRLQALPGAPAVLEPNGGASVILYRKDRVRVIAGAERLREFRLRPGSTTRRVVASCCHTALFVEARGAHWLSLYRNLWPDGERPRVDLRTMTSDRADAASLDDRLPQGYGALARCFARIAAAWAAMGFRRPKGPPAAGPIDA